jgi:hypothetical protein
MSNPSITVEVRPSVRASNTQVASATVRVATDLGLIVIHDCRILKNKQGVAWFSLPAFSIPTAGRSFEYHATLELPADLLQLITQEALKSYSLWHAKQIENLGASNVQPNSAR